VVVVSTLDAVKSTGPWVAVRVKSGFVDAPFGATSAFISGTGTTKGLGLEESEPGVAPASGFDVGVDVDVPGAAFPTSGAAIAINANALAMT
jgi:hypothetical protein